MKKFITFASFLILVCMSVYTAVTMAGMPRTYDGTQATVSVYDLLRDPASYDDSQADGIAAAIIQQNLEESHALNDVTSIVFDFRGYDTMGESFILLTAVGGATVILFTKKAAKKEGEKDEK